MLRCRPDLAMIGSSLGGEGLMISLRPYRSLGGGHHGRLKTRRPLLFADSKLDTLHAGNKVT